MDNVTRQGYAKNIGTVRVLYYHGDGYFMVLDRKDERRLLHRDRIIFTKGVAK